ncbi:hypothetical protein K438DRAFT_1972480 [Mycena galopus ATCC 62051]|nr:hypothetical protein K438DRAFT_1972480 [Mycena galopus ATCC 62051]
MAERRNSTTDPSNPVAHVLTKEGRRNACQEIKRAFLRTTDGKLGLELENEIISKVNEWIDSTSPFFPVTIQIPGTPAPIRVGDPIRVLGIALARLDSSQGLESIPGVIDEWRRLKTIAGFVGITDVIHRVMRTRRPTMAGGAWIPGGQLALSTTLGGRDWNRKERAKILMAEDLAVFFPCLDLSPTPLDKSGRTRSSCWEPAAWLQLWPHFQLARAHPTVIRHLPILVKHLGQLDETGIPFYEAILRSKSFGEAVEYLEASGAIRPFCANCASGASFVLLAPHDDPDDEELRGKLKKKLVDLGESWRTHSVVHFWPAHPDSARDDMLAIGPGYAYGHVHLIREIAIGATGRPPTSLVATLVVLGRKTTRNRELHGRVVVLLSGAAAPLGLTLLQSLAQGGAHFFALTPHLDTSKGVVTYIDLVLGASRWRRFADPPSAAPDTDGPGGTDIHLVSVVNRFYAAVSLAPWHRPPHSASSTRSPVPDPTVAPSAQ